MTADVVAISVYPLPSLTVAVAWMSVVVAMMSEILLLPFNVTPLTVGATLPITTVGYTA